MKHTKTKLKKTSFQNVTMAAVLIFASVNVMSILSDIIFKNSTIQQLITKAISRKKQK